MNELKMSSKHLDQSKGSLLTLLWGGPPSSGYGPSTHVAQSQAPAAPYKPINFSNHKQACNTRFQDLTVEAGGEIDLNPTAGETDSVQGTCIGSCVLKDGSKVKFDASANSTFKLNTFKKCLEGTKEKFCDKTSP